MTRRARTTNHRGFTLVEAVSAMTIIAALGSLSSTILFNAIDGYTSAATRSQIQSELSIVMDRVARAFRGIPMDQSGAMEPNIDAVTPTSVTWSSTSSVSQAATAVVLIEGGQPAVTLIDDVATIAFQCFDDDGDAMETTISGPACRNIRRIEIVMSLERHGISESLTTSVHLRNTMRGGSP